MAPIDQHYLTLQFVSRIYLLAGIEFQTFVERLLSEKYDDFDRVRPYGSLGDGGNDGYQRKEGIFYQVYSPLDPKERAYEAAEKLEGDFEKLYLKWNHITEIREFNFIYNDKYLGTNIVIEEARSKLGTKYPAVVFNIILAKTLEKLFQSLASHQLLALNFNITELQSFELAESIIEMASKEIRRENIKTASTIINNSESHIIKMGIQTLEIKLCLLKAKCFQKSENIGEALKIIGDLIKKFPDNIDSILALAEIKLNVNKDEENRLLIEQAEKLEPNNPKLLLNKFARKINLSEIIQEEFKAESFISETEYLASFYRLSAINEMPNNIAKAKEYIAKAISLYPSNFEFRRISLEICGLESSTVTDRKDRVAGIDEILDQIDALIDEFGGGESLSRRMNLYLNRLRLDLLTCKLDESHFVITAELVISDCLQCNFDKTISATLTSVLRYGTINEEAIEDICNYIKRSDLSINDDLAKSLISQLNNHNLLLDYGLIFFQELEQSFALNFIGYFSRFDVQNLLQAFNSDPAFALMFLDSMSSITPAMEDLIDRLQIDGFPKERLKFHIYCKNEDFQLAFEIVKNIDFENLNQMEIREIINVANKFDAWDIELNLLKKLISLSDGQISTRTQIQLFFVYIRSMKFPEAIAKGRELLDTDKDFSDLKNRKIIFSNTLYCCIERGKLEDRYFDVGIELIHRFCSSLADNDSNLTLIPELFVRRQLYKEAYASIVTAIINSKGLSTNEYGRLFVPVCIRIGEHLDTNKFKLAEVEDGAFVYLEQSKQWYRVGDENPLDAISISIDSPKYSAFIGKTIGTELNLASKFNASVQTETVIAILNTEGYIFEKIRSAFKILSEKDLIPGVQAFEYVTNEDGEIDTKHLMAVMNEITGNNDIFFDQYVAEKLPFSFLATNQGGFISGLAKILNSERGYINFSSGSSDDLKQQIERAKGIIINNEVCFLDGTSAVFLAEFGILVKVLTAIPRLKVPHSVIHLMSAVAERFNDDPASPGNIVIRKNSIVLQEFDSKKSRSIKENFLESIRLFESSDGAICYVSKATKSDDFIDANILGEFVDATFLARKLQTFVITDDYRHIKATELFYKDEIPYTSSLALIKAMYELGKISFMEYLTYFGFTSSYRFCFLSISSFDIVKAIIGDSLVKHINIRNLDHFNFKLTLSEDYGVSSEECIRVVSDALFELAVDLSITVDIYEKILLEVFSSLPCPAGKLIMVDKAIFACDRALNSTVLYI